MVVQDKKSTGIKKSIFIKDSYFEAVLDKKINSVDALETEIDYITASLEGCTWQSISSTSFAERC